MHILLRVARDASSAALLFAFGGFFGLAFADASGLAGSAAASAMTWQALLYALAWIALPFAFVWSCFQVISRGWGPMISVVLVGFVLGFSDEFIASVQ